MGLFVCMMCGVSLPVPYASVHRCRRQVAAHTGYGEGCLAFVHMAAAHRLQRGVWLMLPLDMECHGGRGIVTSLNLSQSLLSDSRVLRDQEFNERRLEVYDPFNVLVQWHGFQPTAAGFVPLSIAEFSL